MVKKAKKKKCTSTISGRFIWATRITSSWKLDDMKALKSKKKIFKLGKNFLLDHKFE